MPLSVGWFVLQRKVSEIMRVSTGIHWLKRVAATSLVVASGTTAGGISAETLEELIDEAEGGACADGDCSHVLRLLAHDSRPAVRAVVAEAAGMLAAEHVEGALALLRELARDDSSYVRAAAALGLSRTIERVQPARRIEVVCEWALSGDARERAAIARALAAPTPVLVTDLVLEQLAVDPDSNVRSLALEAAAAHFHQAPDAFRRLAVEALRDDSSGVRRAAEQVLARAEV